MSKKAYNISISSGEKSAISRELQVPLVTEHRLMGRICSTCPCNLSYHCRASLWLRARLSSGGPSNPANGRLFRTFPLCCQANKNIVSNFPSFSPCSLLIPNRAPSTPPKRLRYKMSSTRALAKAPPTRLPSSSSPRVPTKKERSEE